MATPEEIAREEIDAALAAAGWAVQDRDAVNLAAACGVAVREVSLRRGYGEADYLLFAEREAVGAVEAKARGTTLSGVETQSARYGDGLPASIPARVRPLPFLYESTGVETYDASPRHA
jgi:type I restriction enzyme R subunit